MSTLADKPVFVVGASLTGYAVAALLASLNFSNITIIDASPDPTAFNRRRAYSQCLYAKGQRLLPELPHFAEIFEKIALKLDSRRVTTTLPDASTRTSNTALSSGPVYWVMKHTLLQAFDAYLKQHCPQVNVLTSTEFLDLTPPSAPAALPKVLLRGADGAFSEHPAALVLGCDGMYSRVCAAAVRLDDHLVTRHGMAVHERRIPSTGVRAKGFLLSAAPVISAPGAPERRAAKDVVYRFQSDPATGPAFTLLLLPVGADEAQPRVAVVGASGDHPLWQVTDGAGMLAALRAHLPQLRVGDLVTAAEAERFAKTEATMMPTVRWAQSAAGAFRGDDAAVLLLGDAAASFPPDMAQGVNAAFAEACALKQILGEGAAKMSPGSVAREFEVRVGPEMRALAALTECGAVYQYGQCGAAAQFAQAVNRAVRGALARALPGVFAPCADALVRSGLDYTTVASMVDSTTRNLWISTGVAVAVAVAAGLNGSR